MRRILLTCLTPVATRYVRERLVRHGPLRRVTPRGRMRAFS
jgi:hypothetical protein